MAGTSPPARAWVRRAEAALLTALMAAMIAGAPGTAHAGGSGRGGNQCILEFDGAEIDLNAVTGRSEAFVLTPCPTVVAGEHWIPACTWETSTAAHARYPAGYTPLRAEPYEDLAAKLIEVRVVVDQGTAHERSHRVAAAERPLQVLWWSQLSPNPSPAGYDTPQFNFMPVIRPQRIGAHTVHVYVVLAADHWDGFGDDPAVNLLPAGETLYKVRRFETVPASEAG